MNSTKKVLVNSSFYIFSALLVDAVGFILLPIYLIFLDSTEYGKVSIANGFIDVVIILASLSLHMAVGRFYVEYKNEQKKVAQYFCSILTFVTIVSVIFSGILFWLQGVLEKYVFKGIAFFPIVFLVIISIPFRALRNIHRAILRGMQCGAELAIVNLVVFIVQAGLTFLFIGPLKYGAAGMLLAALIVHVLYTFFIFFDMKCKKLLSFSVRWNVVFESLRYSLPIMPHNLSSYIATLVSRVLLNNYFNTSMVGLYSVASQFGTVVDTVESSANNALTPWFFSYKKDKIENRDSINKIIKALAVFYGFCLLGIGLFSQEAILLFVDSEYAEAWKVVPIIVIAFSFKAVYYFYLNVLLYYKEASKKLFIATVVGNLVNVVASAVFTPKMGMFGTGIALVMAQIFIGSVVFIFSRKYDTESIKIYDVAIPLVMSVGFMLLGNIPSYIIFENTLNISNFVIKLCVLLLYIGICVIFNRATIKSYIGRLNK